MKCARATTRATVVVHFNICSYISAAAVAAAARQSDISSCKLRTCVNIYAALRFVCSLCIRINQHTQAQTRQITRARAAAFYLSHVRPKFRAPPRDLSESKREFLLLSAHKEREFIIKRTFAYRNLYHFCRILLLCAK